jgi:hypothetical protein
MEFLIFILLFFGLILWIVVKRGLKKEQSLNQSQQPRNEDENRQDSINVALDKFTVAFDDIAKSVELEISKIPSNQLDVIKDESDDRFYQDLSSGKTKILPEVRLHISFEDGNGVSTERDVTSISYTHSIANNSGALLAFCHLRNSKRTFAFSRIKKVIDIETGRNIDDIGKFLDTIFFASSEGLIFQFLSEHSAGIFVLFCFAKADGAMRAKERTIIMEWAKQNGLNREDALKNLEDEIRSNWYLTDYAFWDAVKELKNQNHTEKYFQSVWQALQDILLSDKTISEKEVKYLRYACKQWGRVMPDWASTKAIR